MYAIESINLRKIYRTRKRRGLLRSKPEVVEALRGVSFSVRHGEVVGLLGPNGAGKTTTIKIVSTLLLPDGGEVYVEGFNVVSEATEVRKRIGLLLTVERGFYGKLTGWENLEYFGVLYDMNRRDLEARLDYLFKLLELDRLGGVDRLFEEFSLGMKARLGLARALLKDPPILLLDEPTLGLDPPSAVKIRSLVRDLAKEGKAILYTTHNMFEAEIVCDRILFIDRGLIVAEGSPSDLKDRIPKLRSLKITVKGDDPSPILSDRSLEHRVNRVDTDLFELDIKTNDPIEALNSILPLLTVRGYRIISFKIEEPSLEDVFLYFSRRAC
ncbi:MAG: ABC transporter ATP-binding protein [Candidatus Bathyarchaeota archaeon]|nr:ABC transporter ATP-binding protein [Candidatus Bathyarchaeota archaeon]